MSESVKIHIGTPEDMGRRFIDAWHRAERGEDVDETHITFCDLESLLAALTPKRLHLLRYVRHNQVRNIKSWLMICTEITRTCIKMWKNLQKLDY